MNLLSVEDGFVRSVGLEIDLYPPYSLDLIKKIILMQVEKAT